MGFHEGKDLSRQSLLNICDTEFCSNRDGFSSFRDAVATAFMPWLIERHPEGDFSARIVSLSGEFGSFSRTKMTPLTGLRTKSEISRSPERCLYANYVISGRLVVEQGDIVTTAEEGDLVVYDSTLPVKHHKLGNEPFQDLAFKISKQRLGMPDRRFENVAIPRTRIIAPLASCFSLLSQSVSSFQPEELTAVGEACAALLPVAVGLAESAPHGEELSSSYYVRELIKFIDSNIGDIELSPGMAAENLGISVRYVHKQFAGLGTTFSKYVTAKRLDLISLDLVSPPGRSQPIFALAYRWGFNDLSTFIRSFKKRFGCSPREYRTKF
jgi:AraC-like DNA-binding protein